MANKRDSYTIFGKDDIITKRERKRRGNFNYSVEQKSAVLALYASEMALPQIAEQTGVPIRTLRYWKTQPWWQTLLDEVRVENEELFRFRAQKIVDKATSAVLERLENGDEVLDKNGNIVRRKVSGKDAAVIGAVMFDKLRTSLNMPTSIHKIVDHSDLKQLAENFKKISREFEMRVVSDNDVPHETHQGAPSAPRTDGEDSGHSSGEASPDSCESGIEKHNGTDLSADSLEGEAPTRH